MRGQQPLELLVGGVLVAIFFYEIFFNLTPTSIRLAVAAALTGGIVLLSMAWILASPRIWRIILFALVLLIAGCWLVGEAGGQGSLDFTKGIRFLLPLFFALWIIELRRDINQQLVFVLAGGTLVIATLASFLRPQEIINNVMRLPAFTGGEDGAHSSAYIIALCTLLIHQLWLNRAISKRMAWSFLALAGVLLLGLRVATPIFMLLNYGLLQSLLAKQHKVITKILLWSAMLISIFAVLTWHEAIQEEARGSETESVENMGSGRIGTWLGRIDLISRRDVPGLLFGSGPGSDRFASEIWWWEKKDSHHDILTVIIESGLVGFMAIALFLFLLFQRLGHDGAPLVWFFLSGSLVSNALMQRPIIATLFWLAVALAAVRVDQRLLARWRQQQALRRMSRRQQAMTREGKPRLHSVTGSGPR